MKFFALLLAFLTISTISVNAQCEICETVVQLIEGWVESNYTESQIQQYLDNICQLFPSYQPICDQIVQEGLQAIIGWINQDEDPQQICQQLGFCTSLLIKPSSKPLTLIESSTECIGCEEVIGIIEQWLENSEDQQVVISALEVVCTYAPDGWETTCDAIIEAGVPEVVNWIVEYENASVVCTQLGLCNSKPKEISKPKLGDGECSTCEEIIGVIENYLASNYSESFLEQALDVACSFIPEWTQVCESYIQNELPQIIAWIEQNETPQTICTQLGVCSSKIKSSTNIKVN
jgi:saposin